MTEKNITLDVNSAAEIQRISASRGDTESRTLIFTLCQGARMIALEEEMTVLFRAEIGGETFVDACEIEGGRAVYTLKSSFTAVAGTHPCELAVYCGSGDGMQVLYCTGLELDIADTLEVGEEISADDRYLALDALINRAETAALEIEARLAEFDALHAGYGISIEDSIISLSLDNAEEVSY